MCFQTSLSRPGSPQAVAGAGDIINTENGFTIQLDVKHFEPRDIRVCIGSKIIFKDNFLGESFWKQFIYHWRKNRRGSNICSICKEIIFEEIRYPRWHQTWIHQIPHDWYGNVDCSCKLSSFLILCLISFCLLTGNQKSLEADRYWCPCWLRSG